MRVSNSFRPPSPMPKSPTTSRRARSSQWRICNLPNVKVFFMSEAEDWNLTLGFLEHACSGKPPGFDKLRRFSIESHETKYGLLSSHGYGSVFNMVNEVRTVLLNDADLSLSIFQPNTSAAEHLHVIEGATAPESMRLLLQSCRTLRTFNYIYGHIHYYEKLFRPLEAVQVLLECHRDTLEELTMLYDDDSMKSLSDDISTREWYMGPELQGFTNLRILRSGMHSLLGLLHANSRELEECPVISKADRPDLVDVLPGSIEQLSILYADEKTCPHLQRLAEVRMQRFPNLRKVAVVFCSEPMEKNVELQMERVEVTGLYQNDQERSAYVYDREEFSWLGNAFLRD